MKQKLVMSLAVLSLATTACTINGENDNQDGKPVGVKVMTIGKVPEMFTASYSGTIEEATGTSLSFAMPGTVKSVSVQIGQKVSKGTLIATLDDTNAKHSFDMAESTLRQAEDAFSRMKKLHDNNSLPEIEWIDIQTKLSQAQSAMEIARKNLTDCKLYSPVAGVISRKDIEPGQNVMPGAGIIKVSSIGTVKVSIPVPENEIAAIAQEQEVMLSVPALGNREFKGHVVEKGIEANPISRTYQVKAAVPNPECLLMPGMICRVNLSTAADKEILVIPANVVQTGRGTEKFVWIAHNGKALRRDVKTGNLTDNGVIVTAGLAAGENLIVEGQQKVSEGTPIMLMK